MADNTVILRVQLDEAGTEKQLQQLVLDIEKTRAAQKDLTKARDADAISADEYAKQVVDLRTQLRGQTQEQSALTKNLELYRAAQNGEVDSYKATQAALSLAIRQQQELAGSAGDTSEASQALTKQIAAYRDMLSQTDAKQGAFFRNLGNYPKGESLAPLVQQLVKLEEAMKSGTLTAQQAADADREAIGYKQRIAQAGAAEGKSFEETTNFIKQYGAAIRPATQELIKLEQEQRQVAESSEEAGEKLQQIGFRFGKAQKDINDATAALKATPEAAKEAGSAISGALGQASEAAEVLGVDVGGLESGFGRAKKGVDIAKSAFGSLRGAMLAVPIFALLAALTALVAYFTKTREGAAQLETATVKLGAIFDVIIDRAGILGKAVAQLFSGEFKAAAETARQSYAGIGDEMQREITLAGDLSKARQKLDRDEINNIDTNKRLLNQVERLKNVRDNEFNTIQSRKAANEAAYKVELEREKTLTDLAQRKVDLLLADINRRGGLEKAGNEELKAYKEALNEVSDIQEDAAGKQNELITNRYQLEQERIDKSIERRAQALALETALLNKQLAQVRVNSNEELSIRQQLLNKGRDAELNVKNLTVKQKQAIDVKYETDSLALTLDFNRRRLQAALQAQADLTAAELAQRQGVADENVRLLGVQQKTVLQLQAEQIEEQRKASIAGLAANADNTAAIAKINAQAAQQQRLLEYADSTRLLQDDLKNKKRIVENDYADGLIKEGEYQRRLAAIAKAGTDAQTIINKDYNQSNAANQEQADEQETAARRTHTAEVKRQEEVKQEIREATVQAAINHTDTIINLFGEESAAGQAALAIKKVLSLAEIAINLQKVISANAVTAAEISAAIPPPAGPILGTAYKIAADALAITAAAASAASILKLQRGGIADGPSHREGGIPLYHNGRPAGIEIEGGEPVLTRSVSQSPLLLSMASAINQLAGGRALVRSLPAFPRLALGGLTMPLVQQQLRGDVGVPIDYERLAQATAKALRKSPPRTIISDIKAGFDRDTFTQGQSNS
jgi:hypothetical protein